MKLIALTLTLILLAHCSWSQTSLNTLVDIQKEVYEVDKGFNDIVIGSPRNSAEYSFYTSFADGLDYVYKTNFYTEFLGYTINDLYTFEDCCSGKNIFRIHIYLNNNPLILDSLRRVYGEAEIISDAVYEWKGNTLKCRYIDFPEKGYTKIIFCKLSDKNEYDFW